MNEQELQQYFPQNIRISEVGGQRAKAPLGEEANVFTKKLDNMYNTYLLASTAMYHMDMQNSLDDIYLQQAAAIKHNTNQIKIDQWYEGIRLKKRLIGEAVERGDISEQEQEMALTKTYSRLEAPINIRALDIPTTKPAKPTLQEKAVEALQISKQIEALKIPEEQKRVMRDAAGISQPVDVEKDFIKASVAYEKALDAFNVQWKREGWEQKIHKWSSHDKGYQPATESEEKEYKLEEANIDRLKAQADKYSGKLAGIDVKSPQKAKIALSTPPTVELMDIWVDLDDATRRQALNLFYAGVPISKIKKEIGVKSKVKK